jgi:4-alpha-glucanotransferase
MIHAMNEHELGAVRMSSLYDGSRSSGILLHITSLPGSYGIGDLGPEAHAFVDALAAAGQGLWQVLPLGPTGYGDSPYQSFSTFAGNELLISPEILARDGLLDPDDLASAPDFPKGRVDYGWVISWKRPLLFKAARRFLEKAGADRMAAYRAFREKAAFWLDDYALFMSIKEEFTRRAEAAGVFGAMWANYWPKDLARRDAVALEGWKREQAADIEARAVLQFFFHEQFGALRARANAAGVKLIGDLPIFVAYDSADVWANRNLFLLDSEGRPLEVAGVPPDYFSADGQLWGNPLYDWSAHRATGFAWWKNRMAKAMEACDIVRIDHFRGFEANWAVPYGRENARTGEWKKGPGAELFESLKAALGGLPVIAEDLGIITEGVHALRDGFGLPGMRVLQFAFSASGPDGGLDAANSFLPHNYKPNAFVYSGTHDNNTLRGWLEAEAPANVLPLIDSYLGLEKAGTEERARGLMREAMKSVAAWCVIPMQDILGLGGAARMNTPSTLGGSNWGWRMEGRGMPPEASALLKGASRMFNRGA